MSIQKGTAPGPLTDAMSPPMYVMISLDRFELEPIGADTANRLQITRLPYCWHIADKDRPEWALIVSISTTQAAECHWNVCLAQCDSHITHCGSGGGPIRESAKHLNKHLNELLDQFLRR